MEKNQIFGHQYQDFAKIFLATFLVFAFMLMTDNWVTSTAFLLVTVYFLDGGHLYSTLLEVIGDPEEVRKKYVWIVLLGSFFLNLFIHLFFQPYFFFYIFYFTVYHNMRQGLGVTFLYRLGEKKSAELIKWSYYFFTVIPFILFHLKPRLQGYKLDESILMPVDFYRYFSAGAIETAFKSGVLIYGIGVVAITGLLYRQKNTRGLLSMLFFGSVYAYAFIVSKSEMESYALLIFSHAIPYYFLMEKRLGLTHKMVVMQKYAWLFLLIIFAVGGVIDYNQQEIVGLFEPLDSLAVALLTTPLISHFIYDAIIWKRGNERFKTFVTDSIR